MTFEQLRMAMRRGWPLVLAVTVIAMVAALVAASVAGNRYEAAATIRMRTPGSLSDQPVRADAIQYLDRLQTTYSDLVGGGAFRRTLRDRLGGAEVPPLTVDLQATSELFTVRAVAKDPQLAANAANEAAKLLIESVRGQDEQAAGQNEQTMLSELSRQRQSLAANRVQLAFLEATPTSDQAVLARIADLHAAVDADTQAAASLSTSYAGWRIQLLDRANLLSVVDPAEPSATATGPGKGLVGAAGALVGLVLGLGLVLLWSRGRGAVTTPDDVADAAGAPVLAEIQLPRDGAALEAGEPAVDQVVRALQPGAVALTAQGDRSAWVVASPTAPAGSLIGVGLAAGMAQLHHAVVVVDADRRRREATRILEREATTSSRAISASADSQVVALDTALDDVWLVPPETAWNGHARIGSVREEVRKRADLMVVTSPPVLEGPDALVLASQVGEVVLVAMSGETTRRELQATVEQLELVDARVRGVVLVHRSRKARAA